MQIWRRTKIDSRYGISLATLSLGHKKSSAQIIFDSYCGVLVRENHVRQYCWRHGWFTINIILTIYMVITKLCLNLLKVCNDELCSISAEDENCPTVLIFSLSIWFSGTLVWTRKQEGTQTREKILALKIWRRK